MPTRRVSKECRDQPTFHRSYTFRLSQIISNMHITFNDHLDQSGLIQDRWMHAYTLYWTFQGFRSWNEVQIAFVLLSPFPTRPSRSMYRRDHTSHLNLDLLLLGQYVGVNPSFPVNQAMNACIPPLPCTSNFGGIWCSRIISQRTTSNTAN
jgi:hypothetical protein